MPGNYFDQFDDTPQNVGPVIRSAPKVSPMPNDYQISKDTRDSARDDRREVRDDRRDDRADAERRNDRMMQFRKDFDAMPGVKEYRVALPQFVQGIKTAPNGQGDNALIYAYAKVMDPGSVVRESEMQMAGSTGSYIDQVVTNLKKQLNVDGSGALPAGVREGLRAEMFTKLTQLHQAYDVERRRYIDDANAAGIDPVRVVGQGTGTAFMPEIERYLKSRQGGAAAAGRTPWQQDTVGAPGGFAGGGDDRKSIAIPSGMQAEYAQYVSQNRGRLDPDAYAAFRAGLDQKYGFGQQPAAQLESYRSEAASMNDRAARGGNLNLRIPAPDADMTVRDRINNSVFNNPVGAFVASSSPISGGMDELAGGVRSLINGTDYDVERDQADAIRRGLADKYPDATTAGSIVGPIAMGGIGGSAALRFAPRLVPTGAAGQFALGTAGGAANGALENNEERLLGAGAGALAGAGGVGLGRWVMGPAADALMRSRAADAVVNTGVRGLNAVTGGTRALRNAPRFTDEQAAMRGALPNLSQIRTNIADAQERGLPYALADADPRLRMLTGQVTRRSVNAREMAENTFGPRSLGQADRAIEAIHSDLAPITDMGRRRDEWLRAAQNASEPLYARANSMGVEIDDNIADMLKSTYGRDALNRAVRISEGEGVDPFKIGFVEEGKGFGLRRGSSRPDTSRDAPISLDELNAYQAGRFEQPMPGRAPNMVGDLPTSGLSPANRGANGKIYVGDQGSSHFGVTEKFPRVHFDGDTGFVTPDGQYLNREQALAWVNANGENIRPSANMPGQLDAIDYREQARNMSRGQSGVRDMSEPAGPRDFAPTNVVPDQLPTFQTLDLVKRGFDSRLGEAKNPLTGEIDFEGNPELGAVEALRQRYLEAIDAKNPIYPQARGEYQKYISRREALDMGYDAPNRLLQPRDLPYVMRQFDEPRLGEYRRGYATQMGDTVNNTRMTANPLDRVYGSPAQQSKVNMLFPDAPRFRRTYDLEKDMERTARETLGGSPTAGRLQADAQLDERGLPETLGNSAVQMLSGGGIPDVFTVARQALGDRMALGLGRMGEERAERLAPLLMDTRNQDDVLAYLDDVARVNAEIERRQAISRQIGGLLGGSVGAANAPRF